MADDTSNTAAQRRRRQDNDSPAATLRAAMRDRLRRTAQSRISLTIFLGLTVVAVVAEPFDTGGALPLLPRILYWAIVVGVSIAAGAMCDEVAERTTRPVNWRAPVKAAVLLAVIYAPFVVLVSHVFRLFGAPLRAYPPLVFLYVLVVSLTVYGVIHVLRPHLKSQQDPAPEMPDPVAAPEVDLPRRPRLSARLSCPDAMIYRVSANDHMTEVATAHGIERIRMRFADAVAEMEPVEGLNVHRSHWVALGAVDGLVRREGKPFVQLVNGEELPVSRTYRPRLEEARPGLF